MLVFVYILSNFKFYSLFGNLDFSEINAKHEGYAFRQSLGLAIPQNYPAG